MLIFGIVLASVVVVGASAAAIVSACAKKRTAKLNDKKQEPVVAVNEEVETAKDEQIETLSPEVEKEDATAEETKRADEDLIVLSEDEIDAMPKKEDSVSDLKPEKQVEKPVEEIVEQEEVDPVIVIDLDQEIVIPEKEKEEAEVPRINIEDAVIEEEKPLPIPEPEVCGDDAIVISRDEDYSLKEEVPEFVSGRLITNDPDLQD